MTTPAQGRMLIVCCDGTNNFFNHAVRHIIARTSRGARNELTPANDAEHEYRQTCRVAQEG